MINDDKRVLEHFYNILDNTKKNEKVEVYRQNIKYLVNKLEKYFEQVERVQELERNLTKYRNGFELQLKINSSIKKKNKRYRELLTSQALKDLIRLQDKGQFLTEDAAERVFYFKLKIEALEDEE